jgi:predicted dehydrogenase
VPTDRGPFRGALIGAGGVARQSHYPAFAHGAGVPERLRLAAVVEAAPEVPDIPGLLRLWDAAGLDAVGPLDFIDVCTPTASHVEQVLWGLERGWHVLCEKPVATTGAEAARVATAARRAGRVVMPCHQYRFNPVWRKLREWLDEGRIGRWHLAEFRTYRLHADPGARAGAVPWRGRRAESRGGVFLDHGTHLLYLLDEVAGKPADVHAWTGRLRHGSYDVEDTADVLLEYADGRAATIFVTWAANRRENLIRFIGEEGTIEWVGGELSLSAACGAEQLDFTAELDKAAYRDWFARLFLEFADAMERGEAERHLNEVAAVADVLERVYATAAAGRRPPSAGVP